jgi:hypothetical protein
MSINIKHQIFILKWKFSVGAGLFSFDFHQSHVLIILNNTGQKSDHRTGERIEVRTLYGVENYHIIITDISENAFNTSNLNFAAPVYI